MKPKPKRKTKWEFNVLLKEDGNLERAFPIAAVSIPAALKLEDDCIVWDVRRRAANKAAEPDRGMLVEFVALSDANANEILEYAKKWGVLGTCSHEQPSSHNRPPDFLSNSSGNWCQPTGREPVEVWRR